MIHRTCQRAEPEADQVVRFRDRANQALERRFTHPRSLPPMRSGATPACPDVARSLAVRCQRSVRRQGWQSSLEWTKGEMLCHSCDMRSAGPSGFPKIGKQGNPLGTARFPNQADAKLRRTCTCFLFSQAGQESLHLRIVPPAPGQLLRRRLPKVPVLVLLGTFLENC